MGKKRERNVQAANQASHFTSHVDAKRKGRRNVGDILFTKKLVASFAACLSAVLPRPFLRVSLGFLFYTLKPALEEEEEEVEDGDDGDDERTRHGKAKADQGRPPCCDDGFGYHNLLRARPRHEHVPKLSYEVSRVDRGVAGPAAGGRLRLQLRGGATGRDPNIGG